MRGQSWEAWGKTVEQGPKAVFWKVFWFIIFAFIVINVVGFFLGWFGAAAQVVKEELAPRKLLERYEWFKDAAAQLDARGASIEVYEKRFANLNKAYEGQPRGKWSREDREQANLWEQELAGIKASYNGLAAEYNSAMAKINWAFCNAGELPRGADKVLPREFRTYKGE